MQRTAFIRFATRRIAQQSAWSNAARWQQCERVCCTRLPATCISRRFASDASTTQPDAARPLTDRTGDVDTEAQRRKQEIEARKAEQPSYQLTFTCNKCMERSSHRISKQGYHHGTILINCPGCNNKHLISDHLSIFSDRGVTLEDIMKEKGQLLKKGALGANGDVEFYEEEAKT